MMKQKSRLFFITSWLVLRLRWSLAFLRVPVSYATLERLWAQPGIILFSRQHGQFPLDRWCFDEGRSAYLCSPQSEKPLRVYHLPNISHN
ncbi:hypothetical protein L0337_08640 [candidate division KSB1 bacterium]|nr:hypothetical protein [candidate division KSB1 bacterium]